jgi:phage-related protein
MFNAKTTFWNTSLQNIEGINYVVSKPIIVIKGGEVVIVPTRTKLSKIYSAKSNSKDFNLDLVEVTKFVS